MEYTPAMSVKVMQLDNEHKRLIDLANALNMAMKEGKGKEAMSKVLNDLVMYTKTHFKSEEELMQKHNYTGYAEQKKQHGEFVNKVLEMQKSFEAGNVMLSVQTINFLNSWISNHIQKVDAQYGSFFNEKGVR